MIETRWGRTLFGDKPVIKFVLVEGGVETQLLHAMPMCQMNKDVVLSLLDEIEKEIEALRCSEFYLGFGG